jgi:hypothetical protein
MTKNIEDLLYRGDSLERMGDISSRLREDSRKYKKAAVRINWELLLKQVSARHTFSLPQAYRLLTKDSTDPSVAWPSSLSFSYGGGSSRHLLRRVGISVSAPSGRHVGTVRRWRRNIALPKAVADIEHTQFSTFCINLLRDDHLSRHCVRRSRPHTKLPERLISHRSQVYLLVCSLPA